MHRHLLLLISLLLFHILMFAEDRLPIIEIKADRTMIYPQRMDLTGEETLMDILQLFFFLVQQAQQAPQLSAMSIRFSPLQLTQISVLHILMLSPQ